MKSIPALLGIIFILFIIGCGNRDTSSEQENPSSANNIAALSYSITGTQPHDTSYYTEGLEFYNNNIIESTGMYGKSKLVLTNTKTWKPEREISLDPKLFGEGVTVLHDTAYQMTWQEHIVTLYDARNFKKLKQLPLNYEGWGLTNDGKHLIATDGSSNLYFYEPGTFKLLNKLSVTENGVPAVNLNELEYINGALYANQWQYNDILRINPSSGEVTGKIDLTNLVDNIKAKDAHADVLNGIAYNPATGKIYITGKYWPSLFEIQFSH